MKAALRSALFAAWFYGLTLVLGLCAIPLRLGARSLILGYAQCWAGLVLGGLRIVCGVRTVLIGAENLPAEGPALIAAEHQSAFDTLVWMTLLPRPAYVLKHELTRIPLFGPLLLGAGMIAVRRTDGAAALRRLLSDTGAARQDGRQIIIFPQGTRVGVGQTAPLQPGVVAVAGASGLPIIPVATDSGRRWARHAFRKHAGPVHIVVRPPIAAGLPRRALLDRLQEEWAIGRAAMPPLGEAVDSSGE